MDVKSNFQSPTSNIIVPVNVSLVPQGEAKRTGESLTEESVFEARGGLYVLDVEIRELGLEVTHVKHLYGYTHCSCGHITLTEPGRCFECEGWQVQLSEWHLIGRTLASLIICLALRMKKAPPNPRIAI